MTRRARTALLLGILAVAPARATDIHGVTLRAFEILARDAGTGAARAMALLVKDFPTALVDPVLRDLGRQAFGEPGSPEAGKARAELRRRGETELLASKGAAAAFAHLEGKTEIFDHFARHFRELETITEARARHQRVWSCVTGMRQVDDAIFFQFLDTGELPDGSYREVLRELAKVGQLMGAAPRFCPLDNRSYSLDRATQFPRVSCPNHGVSPEHHSFTRRPTLRDEERMARTNSLLQARAALLEEVGEQDPLKVEFLREQESCEAARAILRGLSAEHEDDPDIAGGFASAEDLLQSMFQYRILYSRYQLACPVDGVPFALGFDAADGLTLECPNHADERW